MILNEQASVHVTELQGLLRVHPSTRYCLPTADRAVIRCFWSQLSWENCWTNSALSQFKSGGFATDFGVTPTRGNNQT